MGRQGFYLYKRAGSNNYWLRLVFPPELVVHYGRKRIEKSLKTSNRLEAELAASEEIRKHKLALLAVERAREGKFQPMGLHRMYEPGTTTYTDDHIIVANGDDLIYLDKNHKVVNTDVNWITLDLTNTIDYALQHPERNYLSHGTAKTARRYMSKVDRQKDEKLFERWLSKNRVTSHIERDARNVWGAFKELVGNKRLHMCGRRDAVRFVEYLCESGLADKTVGKKISYLSAVCNIAVQDELLDRNIFAGVSPKIRKNWSTARQCLSDEEMEKAREHLSTLSCSDRLLWMLLATTGMRLSEPFEVREEHRENDDRFIVVGTKTESSRRRVPLPDVVLPFLPERIVGPLFPDSPETHGKRLRRFLQRLQISYDSKKGTGDQRKTLHSLRHRAATKLREADIPEEVQEELLGHKVITIADGYGRGRSIAKLKAVQAVIGY